MKGLRRGIFEYEEPHIYGAKLDITAGTNGLLLGVSEEKSRDSYNVTETCNVALTRAEARRLRDWLSEMLA